MALGITLFVLALILSVVLHEAGHMLVAKRYGMKVTEFFCGFGPRVFSFKRGETEYGLKAIPAGGYVKIVGMSPEEELDEADQPRAFWRQRARYRAATLAAGGLVHFLIGFVLLVTVFSGTGLPSLSPVVGTVAPCLDAPCGPGSEQSPAARAGLEVGDRIVAVNGERVQSWQEDAIPLIRGAEGPLTVEFERDGEVRQVELTPVQRTGVGAGGAEESVGVIGVVPQIEMERVDPVTGAGKAAGETWKMVTGSLAGVAALPASMYHLTADLLTGEERRADGPVGVVGAARLSGQLVDAPMLPTAGRIAGLLALLAGINVFLGVFNLLPVLPLDGGHLAVLAFEQARHRVRRLRGYRGEVQRVDINTLLPVVALGLSLFVGLSLILLLADIIAPLTNPLG